MQVLNLYFISKDLKFIRWYIEIPFT